jgi:hypothetical protein
VVEVCIKILPQIRTLMHNMFTMWIMSQPILDIYAPLPHLLAKISFPNIAQMSSPFALGREETKRLAIATSQNWEIQIGWFLN